LAPTVVYELHFVFQREGGRLDLHDEGQRVGLIHHR
jgi:hypothetical protein